jgi:hypothetical protein
VVLAMNRPKDPYPQLEVSEFSSSAAQYPPLPSQFHIAGQDLLPTPLMNDEITLTLNNDNQTVPACYTCSAKVSFAHSHL